MQGRNLWEFRALAFSLLLTLLPELSPALQAPGAVAGQHPPLPASAQGNMVSVRMMRVSK